MVEPEIVDAHHHFWDPIRNYHPWLCDEPLIPFRYGDYSSIRKPFLPDDYFRAANGHNVVKTVTMEGEWDPRDPVGESHWIQQVAEEHGYPHAHVAQIWLDADDVAETLKAQAKIPLVRSVRHKPRSVAAPDQVVVGAPGSMGDPKWRRGYAMLADFGLHFDLQTPWWHLYEAAELADAFPQTTIILNHTGLPSDRSPVGLDGWQKAMTALASVSNVVVKISGLGLADKPWLVEDNGPIIRTAIEIFGPHRCMFASNFPVDGLIADLPTIITGFQQAISDLSEDDRRLVLHDNAVGIYRL